MNQLLKDIIYIRHEDALKLSIPLILSRIKAGFPSPAEDYVEGKLDFNEYLVKHPAATFCVRVSGDSMIEAGINQNDILVVDRSLNPKNNNIVIAVIDGELTVKILHYDNSGIFLVAANKNFNVKKITPDMNFEVWGTVTHVIKDVL